MPGRIASRFQKFLSRYGSGSASPDRGTSMDLEEEYANAFRTESYNVFWERVVALSNDDLPTSRSRSAESTTAARLSSYRIFVDHLLEPDQPTVTRILSLTRYGAKHKSILNEYFTETANASLLCSLLLKNIDRTRARYNGLKAALESAVGTHGSADSTQLVEFLNPANPLIAPASPTRVQSIQTGCSRLLKRLESSRDKARTKLRYMNKLKNGSATLLVALTASLSILIMVHGVALVVAAPGLLAAAVELASSKKLSRVLAQLDAAAKGTYILKRDIDTISRLVSRLNDELDHMNTMVKFWLDRGQNQQPIQTSEELAQQLSKKDCNFGDQLDELEEHLYLCFMTINRARNLVVKEILNPNYATHIPFLSMNG